MHDPQDDDMLGARLRQHLNATAEPQDDGFNLRVMARLPAQPLARHRQRARTLKQARWAALSLAACGLALLAARHDLTRDPTHALAALALLGLLVFWAIPSRWSRG